jgi:hypothetical protein
MAAPPPATQTAQYAAVPPPAGPQQVAPPSPEYVAPKKCFRNFIDDCDTDFSDLFYSMNGEKLVVFGTFLSSRFSYS